MHAMTFQLKRAHLQGVAFGKKIVRRVRDMTPARYDLLYAIRGDRKPNATQRLFIKLAIPEMPAFFERQDTLRRRLGLDHSTVSIMIKRLIELGWVTKRRSEEDRRTNTIALTDAGQRAIDRASRIVYEQRTHLLHFELMFKEWWPKRFVLAKMDEVWLIVREMGRRFGDRSTLHFDIGLACRN